MTFQIVMQEVISYPRDGEVYGWADDMRGGYAANWQTKAEQIIERARECEVTHVLLRGYSTCADRHSKWFCGTRTGDDGNPVIMRTGVRCSAALPVDELEARTSMMSVLHDAGLTVWAHDGPAITEDQAVLSAYWLALDGVDYAVIDSSANNESSVVSLQQRECDLRGVIAIDEPVGDGNRQSLARVEAERFPWDAIEAGTVDPARVFGWFNNPEQTRDDPKSWLRKCIEAKLAGVVMPYPLLKAARFNNDDLDGGGV